MLACAAPTQFGATDAAEVAITAGHPPAGFSVRVGDLGGRGIMATSFGQSDGREGVLDRSSCDWGPSWTVAGASWGTCV
eukprot:2362390-Pyramimonas_sp.AAC.1